MRNIFLAISFLASGISGLSQSLKKYSVSNSGCFIYNYCDIKFESSKSQDSSIVYTGECIKDEVMYGVICVKLLIPVTNLLSAEDLLVSYADYLKGSFEIVKATGYGKGNNLNQNENTRGIVDYWEDADKNKWKIKAWTDGRYIGFMYVYRKKELPEQKVNVFLDSFRFPAL